MNPTSEHSQADRVIKVPFTELPGQSALFLDYLDPDADLPQDFWPNRNKPLSDYATEVLSDYSANRQTLCDGLELENLRYKADTAVLENIQRLRDADCVAVVTGQQAGLFSGPAYTVYKALSAARISENLNKNGVMSVPVFWIATEDHDFAEISTTNVYDADRTVKSFSISVENSELGSEIGNLKLRGEIKSEIEDLFDTFPTTPLSAQLKEAVSASYEPGSGIGAAFGKLLTQVMRGFGIILVNPLNPVIRKIASPVYSMAVKKTDEIKRELLTRTKLLEQNGYHEQVLVEDDFVPLFAISEDGKRLALRKSSNDEVYTSKDGSLRFTQAELLKRAAEQPETLSPNALLRPVVQDYVFPTVCYVGGAAEIAYFAQNSAIYKILDRPVTPTRHRAGFTILESKHRRTLDAYGLDNQDLFKGLDLVLGSIAAKQADQNIIRLFDSANATLDDFAERFGKAFSDLDQGLTANVNNRKEKIAWHLEKLNAKFILAETRRDSDLNRRIRDLFRFGMPNDGLQERTINFIQFLNNYGPELLKRLYENTDDRETAHKIYFEL